MRRGGGISLGFPPFAGAVKWLVIINGGIFLLLAILTHAFTSGGPAFARAIEEGSALQPDLVIRGEIWRLFSYVFVNEGFLYILFGLLALWMFGAEFETRWGSAIFLQFYFFCTLGAALTAVGIAYLFFAINLLGFRPDVPVIGLNGPLYGILAAFGVLYGDRDVMMFPLPITMKARYMVIIWLLIAVYLSIVSGPGGILNVALLGGALFGYLWVKFMPARGMGFYFSERYYGLRNNYYRWKRRRAARKFEVYMSKHDRSQYFDHYGNFKPPEERGKGKPNGEAKGPWAK